MVAPKAPQPLLSPRIHRVFCPEVEGVPTLALPVHQAGLLAAELTAGAAQDEHLAGGRSA